MVTARNNSKPSVLIVLSRLPDDVSFLTSKFIHVGRYITLDIVAWDTSENRRNYLQILKSHSFKGRIYLCPQYFTFWSALAFVFRYTFPLAAKVGAIARFLRQGYKILGVDIFKRLFFDVNLVLSDHDIWHFEFGARTPDYCYLKKVFPGKKMTTSFRGYDLNYVALADSRFYETTWENYDGFHFLGQDLKARAIKRGYKMEKVEAIIPPAIDTDFFQPVESKPKGNKLIIVSVGRLVWKKGFEYGIRAMKILKERNIPFEYQIIGTWDYQQALEYTVYENQLRDEVKFVGKMQRAELRDKLATADVFLHPAISEGFCNAVLEAQAMGLPVICSDADGLGENVVNGETGFVVPKWNIEQLAEKLEWCYNNYDEARQMGKNGVKRVHRHFKLEDQIQAFVRFYCTVHETA